MLLRQARRAPAREVASHYLVLRQPPLYRALGLGAAGLGAVLLAATLLSFDWVTLPRDAHEQVGFGFALLGALLFLGLSVPLLLASDGPRGRHVFLPWPDIVAVRYNMLTYELKNATPQATIKAGRYLVGFDQLVAELARRRRLTPAQMGLPPEAK